MAFRFAPYQSATTDSGGPTPGALALRRYCLARWDFATFMGLYNPRNVRGGSRLSHHAEGRALDIGIPTLDGGRAADAEKGMQIVDALGTGADRLGIDHLIYDRTIWSPRKPEGRPYTGVHPHFDHIHLGMTRAAGASLNLATIISVLGPIESGGEATVVVTEKASDRVMASSLRLRTEPSLSATIIAELPRGAGVIRLEDTTRSNDGHDWVQVRVRDGESAVDGWVAAGFLQPTGWKPDAGIGAVQSTTEVSHRVNASTLRLRAEPATSAAILTELPRGTGVEQLGDDRIAADGHEWIQVRVIAGDRPTTGWVAATFLDEVTHRVQAPSGLRVRNSPTTSAEVIIDLTDGSDVIQLSDAKRSADGHDWVKVRAHLGERTETGWVASEFLEAQGS